MCTWTQGGKNIGHVKVHPETKGVCDGVSEDCGQAKECVIRGSGNWELLELNMCHRGHSVSSTALFRFASQDKGL